MQALDFLLPGPPVEMTPDKKRAFDLLWQSRLNNGFIDYQLPYPKWQYLSYLCEMDELVLHGSQNQSIDKVEPHQANDKKAFSNQCAIYATTDGIWVIFFAILDRQKYPEMSLFNSCLQSRLAPNQLGGPLYFFSITHSVLVQKPWCGGAIYILPRKPFQQEAHQQLQGVEIVFPHWISSVPAEPAARLLVEPQDFPFLDQIHGHNDQKLVRMAASNPDGFPWPEALES
jgi:hypothetical protein